MEYVVQPLNISRNLVHAETNATCRKTGFKLDFFAWQPINFMHARMFAQKKKLENSQANSRRSLKIYLI